MGLRAALTSAQALSEIAQLGHKAQPCYGKWFILQTFRLAPGLPQTNLRITPYEP